jgi:hypothetical protein
MDDSTSHGKLLRNTDAKIKNLRIERKQPEEKSSILKFSKPSDSLAESPLRITEKNNQSTKNPV